jgi:hypothetical protein
MPLRKIKLPRFLLMESVGQLPEAINIPQDVTCIQYLLNLIYPYKIFGYLPEDGKCSDKLINMIRKFQQFELNFPPPDGVINRDGKNFFELAKRALQTPRVQKPSIPSEFKSSNFNLQSENEKNNNLHKIVENFLFDAQGALGGMAFSIQELMTSRINGSTTITTQDYINIANRLGNNIDYKLVEAFGMVESGGKTGFNELGLPKIAYQGHHFRRLSKHIYDKTHPDLSYIYPHIPAGPQWKINNASQAKSWDCLRRAYELNPEAALMAASWGTFQVMGFNYMVYGYSDVFLFANDMKLNSSKHFDAFIAHCTENGLIPNLITKTMSK